MQETGIGRLCVYLAAFSGEGRMGLIETNAWKHYTLKTDNFQLEEGMGKGYDTFYSPNAAEGSTVNLRDHNSAESPQKNYSEARITVTEESRVDKRKMREFLCEDCVARLCRVSGGFDMVLVDYTTGDLYPVWPDSSKVECGDHLTTIKVCRDEIKLVTSRAG